MTIYGCNVCAGKVEPYEIKDHAMYNCPFLQLRYIYVNRRKSVTLNFVGCDP